MHKEIAPEKIPFLQEIAYFSLDISAKAYARLHPENWQRIHSISKKVIEDSGFSTSGPALNVVIQKLDMDTRTFFIEWINSSYLAENSLGRSWASLDFYTDRDWVRRYGFASLDECVDLLGTRLFKAINEMAHEMGHQFMIVDEFCTKLEEEVLSEWDMFVAAKYGMHSNGWDITNVVSEYCVAVIFRNKLKEIPFSEAQIDILNEKVNECIHNIHPSKPKVNIRDVLR